MKQSNIIIEQQRKKIEILTNEYYSTQAEKDKKLVELETVLAEKEEKLLAYEALEKDLDFALISAGQGKRSLLVAVLL